jgi:hypothetical protein
VLHRTKAVLHLLEKFITQSIGCGEVQDVIHIEGEDEAIVHFYLEEDTWVDFRFDIQSPPKVKAQHQKWMFMLYLADSGVVKLVGGVSCDNISDNISSVTCFSFGDAKLEKILNSRLKNSRPQAV